ENVRPVRKALGERIEKENGGGERSKFEGEGIELPGCDEEQSHGGECEEPRELEGKRARGESSLLRPRILAVEAEVGDTVHGHRRRARRDHGDNDPDELAQSRPALWWLVSGAGGEKRSRQ